MFHSILLITALCIDSFAASIAYGANGIKIPLRSAFVISGVGALFLGLSFYAAFSIREFVPPRLCMVISFCALLLIGIYNLVQSLLKSYLKSRKQNNLKFSLAGFMIQIYLDETSADIDNSKVLSVREALYLAVAVSIDSLITGFGTGLVVTNQLQIVFFTFLVNMAAIGLGFILGGKLKNKFNLSWLGGALLILLAFMKII